MEVEAAAAVPPPWGPCLGAGGAAGAAGGAGGGAGAPLQRGGSAAFGAAPATFAPPALLGSAGRGAPALRVAHGFMGECRHGACSCYCDCCCACECIARNTSSCNCVPIEARTAAGTARLQEEHAAFAGFFAASTFGSGSPAGAPAAAAPGPAAWEVSLAGAGFGSAPGGGAFSSDGSNSFCLGTNFGFRKRPNEQLDAPPFPLQTAAMALVNEPPLKKCIRQTMDMRGNYRPVAVDAAEVMAD